MKVLFLTGGNVSRPLVEWLGEREEVSVRGERLGADEVRSLAPDVIVSHSYRHVLTRDVLAAAPGRFINLHVSLLPFNRGADPNFWSFIDDTPKGVTVHRIDQGIDTGPILLQREVSFDASGETLASSYDKLQQHITELFIENWPSLRHGRVEARQQNGSGTYHKAREFAALKERLLGKEGWAVPISVVRERYREIST